MELFIFGEILLCIIFFVIYAPFILKNERKIDNKCLLDRTPRRYKVITTIILIIIGVLLYINLFNHPDVKVMEEQAAEIINIDKM